MSLSPAPSEDYKQDVRYKKYAAAVEKNLQTFEAISEWPDFISFLNRLGKTLTSFTHFPTLPKKLVVSKRLAQCLNPALPGGVHQKTIELYDLIFKKIGPDILAHDLSIYAIGLFPFFEHAKTITRSDVLSLVERHLVPLGRRLLPSLQSLLLALLPGLEEDNSEYFFSVVKIVNLVRDSVGPPNFYRAVWTALLISPRHRHAIVNYILKELPTRLSAEKYAVLFGQDYAFVVAAVAAALSDRNSLVVRGLLDILITHFPVEADIQTAAAADTVVLCKEALQLLLRRDMSLTRRIYFWITGSTSETAAAQLSPSALNIVTLSIRQLLSTADPADVEPSLRPFKILVFLMDKAHIAKPIINNTLVDLLSAVKQLLALHPSSESKIVSSANLLFDIVDLNESWSILCRAAVSAAALPDFIGLVRLSVLPLSLCDDEATRLHLPLFLLALFQSLSALVDRDEWAPCLVHHLPGCLDLCLAIISRFGHPDAFFAESLSAAEEASLVQKALQDFIVEPNSITTTNVSFSRLVSGAACLFADFSQKLIPNLLKGPVSADATGKLLQTIERFYALSPDTLHNVDMNLWIQTVRTAIVTAQSILVVQTLFNHLIFLEDVLLNLQMVSVSPIDPSLVRAIAPTLWDADDRAEQSVSAAILLTMCRVAPTEIDNFMAKQLISGTVPDRSRSIVRFSAFWEAMVVSEEIPPNALSKCLFSLIDMMSDPNLDVQTPSRNWFSHSLGKLERVLDPLLYMLVESLTAVDDDLEHYVAVYTKPFNMAQVEYALRNLSSVLVQGAAAVSNFMSSTRLPFSLHSMATKNMSFRFKQHLQNSTYASSLVAALLCFACTEPPPIFNDVSRLHVESIQALAQSILTQQLQLLVLSVNELFMIRDAFAEAISYHLGRGNYHRSAESLRVLEVCLLRLGKPQSEAFVQESQPFYENITLLCCTSIRQGTYADFIKRWSDFAETIASLHPEPNLELLLPILKATMARLGSLSLAKGQESSTSFINALIRAVERICFLGLEKEATHEPPTAPAPSAKTSGTSTFSVKNVFATSSSSTVDRLTSDTKPNAVIRLLPHVVTELGGLHWHLSTIGLSPPCESIKRALSDLYFKQPMLFLSALVESWAACQENNNLDPIKLFLDIERGPFAKDFVRNLVSLYRALKDCPAKLDTQKLYMPRQSLDTLARTIDALICLLADCSVGLSEALLADFWQFCVVLVRDSLTNTVKHRNSASSLLRWAIVLAEQTIGVDQRKLSRENLDGFQRACEFNIAIASKLNDPLMWVDSPQNLGIKSFDFSQDKLLLQSTRDKPALRCLLVIYDHLVPKISKLVADQDKVQSLFALIISQLISPTLRGSLKRHFPGVMALESLGKMLEPPLAVRLWKKDLWDSFYDPFFFQMPLFHFKCYSKLIRVALANDPDKFVEIIGKIPSSNSATIFLSKEIENINRATMIRRLSFAVFCCDVDLIKINIPALQEKLVDILKLPVGVGAAEIYLFMRILVLRLPEDVLAGLWPIIITELIQLFQLLLKTPVGSIGKDLLVAVHQACKLLDTMLLMASGTITMYAWAFVSSPELENQNWFKSGAILDKVCEHHKLEKMVLAPEDCLEFSNRRPILTSRSISDIKDLSRFIRFVNLHLKSIYIMKSKPDISAIAEIIQQDFIECTD